MTLIIYFFIEVFVDYTVCKSVLLLYLDIKINYECYFLNQAYLRLKLKLLKDEETYIVKILIFTYFFPSSYPFLKNYNL